MKIVLILVLASLLLLTSCSDIAYPPRGIDPDEIGADSEPAIGGSPTTIENRYILRSYDLTETTFHWEHQPETPYVISFGGDESELSDNFTVTPEFNAPQHYRISITAVALAGNPVVSISSVGQDDGTVTFGAFYISGDTVVSSDDEEASDESNGGNEEGQEYFMSPLYFPEGIANLTFTVLRGSVRIDSITAVNTTAIDRERFNTPSSLSHPSPSDEAADLFGYLNSQFGQRVLTAQHCTVNTNAEIDAVYAATGRRPAVRFGNLAAVFEEGSREIELAKEWSEKGGIVGFTWMWNSPCGSGGYFANEASRTALDRGTDFSLSEAISGVEGTGVAQMGLDLIEMMVESEEIPISCMQMISDIDKAAQALRRLANENIPVLFNPIPDGGSRLYWWGVSGGEDYVSLWRLMYERMVNYHGLDNLIWIWSGGNHEYYPGDNRVDIIGESVFIERNEVMGSQAVRLDYTEDYSENAYLKPAIVVAGSRLPSPDAMARDNAAWLIWALYKGDFVIDSYGNFLPEVENMLDRFYNHELTICLDELPNFVM